jgi:hypothetical protein
MEGDRMQDKAAMVRDEKIDCIVADRPRHLPPLTIEQLKELVRMLLFCHSRSERMAIGLHLYQSRPLADVARAMDVSELRAREVIAAVRLRVKLAAV